MTGPEKATRLEADTLVVRELQLVDAEGRERVHVGHMFEMPFVHLNDAEGRPRLTLQLDREGNPAVVMFTSENAVALSICLRDGERNGMTVCDPQGHPCVSISVPSADSTDRLGTTPRIEIRDQEGDEIWSSDDETRETRRRARRRSRRR